MDDDCADDDCDEEDCDEEDCDEEDCDATGALDAPTVLPGAFRAPTTPPVTPPKTAAISAADVTTVPVRRQNGFGS
ncbi:hypothetical protein FHS29_006902 [Saccharothrix tamanrassetensis]|uniref:Uncharacterized protein n=1 Tax=Saccharothrix tamanrassetensis TaxID=1051531 RepID=A0A841CSK0_9PSEU|nr:hypothetical protein [Saccharothrix tamanrassetensis]MBB5960279.1 hypothetical protein [Saccharothrix tamanrassetensis]